MLGGKDDKKSPIVKKFQIDYNIVSKAKMFVSGMGRLSEDGLVGGYTLNAMRYATEKLGGKHWPDVVKEAKGKGFAIPAFATIPTTKPKQMVFQKPPETAGAEDDTGEYGQTSGAAPKKKGSMLPILVGAAAVVFLMAKK